MPRFAKFQMIHLFLKKSYKTLFYSDGYLVYVNEEFIHTRLSHQTVTTRATFAKSSNEPIK